jgi:hypothetical protein
MVPLTRQARGASDTIRPYPAVITVHVVCLPGRIEVFDNLDAAGEYAAQNPSASRFSVPLRHGIEAAVLVANRRVIVQNGRVQSIWQSDMLDFYDGDYVPPAADVEAYEKEPGEWHIVGFGTDREMLGEQMAQAVASASRGQQRAYSWSAPIPASFWHPHHLGNQRAGLHPHTATCTESRSPV